MKKNLFFKIVMLLTVVVLAVNCKDYDDDISNLNDRVTGLESGLTKKLEEKAAALQTSISSVKSALEAKDAEFATKMAAMQAGVDALKASAATKEELAAKVKELADAADANAKEMTAKLTALTDELAKAATKEELAAKLKEFADEADAKTKEMAAKLTALTDGLAKAATKEELADQKVALEKMIKDAEAAAVKREAMLATKAELAVTNSTLENLSNELSEVTTKLNENVALTEGLVGKVTSLTAKVDDYILEANAKLDALGVDVGNLKDAVKTLKEGTTKLEGDLLNLKGELASKTQSLETQINTVNAAVALNTTAVEGNTAKIADLKKDLMAKYDELKDLNAALDAKVAGATASITALEQGLKNTYTKEEVDAAIAAAKEDFESAMSAANEAYNKLTADVKALTAKLAALAPELVASVNNVLQGRLTSVVFYPELYVNGIEAIVFQPLVYNCGNEMVLAVKETEAKYHLNPSTVTESKINTESLALTTHSAKNITTRAAEQTPHLTASYKGIGNAGMLSVAMKADPTWLREVVEKQIEMEPRYSARAMVAGPPAEEIEVVALQVQHSKEVLLQMEADGATNSETVRVNGNTEPAYAWITSDYARVYVQPFNSGRLNLTKDVDNCAIHKETLGETKSLTLDNELVVQLPYDKTVDLKDYVVTTVQDGKGCVSWEEMLKQYGLAYVFDLLDSDGNPIVYNLGDNDTPQQEFIKVTDATKGTIAAKVYEVSGKTYAAINRTPIVRVRLVDTNNDNCTVKEAFIKVHIVKETVDYTPLEVEFNAGKLGELCDDFTGGVTVKQMNVNIYNEVELDKDTFHEVYGDGSVEADGLVGTVTIKVDSEAEESYAIEWTVTSDELWAHAGEQLSAVIKYEAAGYKTVKITLKAPVFNGASYDIPAVNLIENYWNDAKTFVKHNVAVPVAGSTDSSTCTWENNINSAFVNKDKALKLPEGMANYEYVFAPAEQQISGVTDAEGNVVTITVSADGKELKANDQVVAIITNFQDDKGDLLTYNENSELAKYLLNKGKDYMWAKLMIKSYACNDVEKKVKVTVNGKDGFNVHFLRPINIAGQAEGNFVDGVDFGAEGSVLDVLDVVALSDWRNYSFKENENYYNYYGVSAIEADVAKITTNINGVKQTLPSTLEVAQVASGAGVATPAADYPYGAITYKNNGTTVENSFELYIPVKVTYKWGEVVSTVITVKVNTTVGQ